MSNHFLSRVPNILSRHLITLEISVVKNCPCIGSCIQFYTHSLIRLEQRNHRVVSSTEGTVLETGGVFYKINSRVSLTSNSFHLIEKICILRFIGTQPRGTWWNEPSARSQRTELWHAECTVRPWARRVTYACFFTGKQ